MLHTCHLVVEPHLLSVESRVKEYVRVWSCACVCGCVYENGCWCVCVCVCMCVCMHAHWVCIHAHLSVLVCMCGCADRSVCALKMPLSCPRSLLLLTVECSELVCMCGRADRSVCSLKMPLSCPRSLLFLTVLCVCVFILWQFLIVSKRHRVSRHHNMYAHCVCMCVCMHAHWVYIHAHLSTLVCMCGCADIPLCICMHAFTSLFVCLYMFVCVKSKTSENGSSTWDDVHLACCQLQQEQDQGISDGDGLTMKRLVVWTYDPLLRLKTLAALVDACKGGLGIRVRTSVRSQALISASFWQNSAILSGKSAVWTFFSATKKKKDESITSGSKTVVSKKISADLEKPPVGRFANWHKRTKPIISCWVMC